MKRLPENPYALTQAHLEAVRNDLLKIAHDKDADAKDRVAAAKVIASIVDQIWKFNTSKAKPVEVDADADAESDIEADPFERLTIVA